MLGLYSLERINKGVCTYSLAEMLVKTPKSRTIFNLLCRCWYYGCRSKEPAAYRYTSIHISESSHEECSSVVEHVCWCLYVFTLTQLIKSYLNGFLSNQKDVLNIWSEHNYIFSYRMAHTTTCFGPVYWPSSVCIINLISSYIYTFIIQPDDGQYTGPEHVVVCIIFYENI